MYSDRQHEVIIRALKFTADGQGRTQLKQQLGEFIDRHGNGFRTYDGSHGHCPLCGRLGCNGYCFK